MFHAGHKQTHIGDHGWGRQGGKQSNWGLLSESTGKSRSAQELAFVLRGRGFQGAPWHKLRAPAVKRLRPQGPLSTCKQGRVVGMAGIRDGMRAGRETAGSSILGQHRSVQQHAIASATASSTSENPQSFSSKDPGAHL